MSQPAFKSGERIAVPALPVLKVENDVAILKKMRFTVGAECGARHKVRIETPFYIRGGFRVERKKMYKVSGWAFEVVFKTPYGSFVKELVPQRSIYLDKEPTREFVERLVREMFGNKVEEIINIEVKEQPKPVDVYVRRFRHVEVLIPPDDYFIHFRHLSEYHGDTYFVYEFVNENEAKLVDDTSRIDYVLLVFGHGAESRAGCAAIKILNGDIVWSDVKSTCCAIKSDAVAVVIARYGSKITIARNNLPYRGCCESWEIEEWVAEFPPRRVTQYTSTEPVATTDVRPEDVA